MTKGNRQTVITMQKLKEDCSYEPFCTYLLEQGSPTPRPTTRTSQRPVRNQAARQEVISSEASSATPHHSPSLALPPEPSPLPPGPWKNYLAQNQSLLPKSLGTAVLENGLQAKKMTREIDIKTRGEH